MLPFRFCISNHKSEARSPSLEEGRGQGMGPTYTQKKRRLLNTSCTPTRNPNFRFRAKIPDHATKSYLSKPIPIL